MSKKAKKGQPDKKEFKYPSDKALLEFEVGLRSIVFKQTLTDHIIHANKAVIACIDMMTPHVDTLQLHQEGITIPEAMHREAYPQWDEMTVQMQNKILRFREIARQKDLASIAGLLEIVDIQARQTLNWDDKLFEKIEELQEMLKLAA